MRISHQSTYTEHAYCTVVQGGDFLWRKDGGLGSDEENDAPGLSQGEMDDTPLKDNSNIEYLQQQFATAITSGAVAFTKLWS